MGSHIQTLYPTYFSFLLVYISSNSVEWTSFVLLCSLFPSYFWLFLRFLTFHRLARIFGFPSFLLQFPKCWGGFRLFDCISLHFSLFILLSNGAALSLPFIFTVISFYLFFILLFSVCCSNINESFTFFPYCSWSLIPCCILCFCTHPKFRVGAIILIEDNSVFIIDLS